VAAESGRLPDLVPPPDELKAVLWERSRDTPVGELLTPNQVAQLRRVGNAEQP
jgi:hypothetical protein